MKVLGMRGGGRQERGKMRHRAAGNRKGKTGRDEKAADSLLPESRELAKRI